MNQPGKVANSIRGQLDREDELFPVLVRAGGSRGMGSAVPSRVSLFVFVIQAESDPYSRDSSRFPRWCSFILSAIRHWVSLEFIGPRNGVPMAFITESPPAHGQ